MALRVPSTTSVCLYCKINSDANAGKEFHEIFDEVGQELQLPFLVKTFFHINLKKRGKQHLCDDCVNRLIELYDVVEHAKEESCKTNNLKNKSECINNEESSKFSKNESGHFRYERENFHKPFVIDQNNTQVNLPKSNSIAYTNFKIFASTQGENAMKMNEQNRSDRTEYENVGYIFKQNSSAPFTQQHNQRRNDIAEDFPKEDFEQNGERKVSQDFNVSLLLSAIKDQKSDVLQYGEHIEFIVDDGTQNMKINKHSNINIIIGSKKFEIKESEVSRDFNISSSFSKKSDKLESNEHIEFISDDENQNVEINHQSNTNKVAKFHNKNEVQKDLYVEEVDDRSIQVLSINDSNSFLEELKITDETEASLLSEEISNENCSLEEEYLIEEIISSKEYDQVDLNEYLDKVLITKFQDLLLNWEMECKLCLGKYYSLGELLNHVCMTEFKKEQQFSCIIKDCQEHAKDLPTLGRHLVLKHYDKLESTPIYGRCTECRKTFSNVLDFNKHSCCQNIKQIIGTPKYCKYCDLDFQSSKRYVFHMQFHLKNHRPKICLLCGDLFNNSNDFFEHTQYTHNHKSALTCERCDRLFKDIQVFNNHMEMHEYSKYQYECALCTKKYANKFGLNQHMDVCHNNKSKALQCEYCTKKLRNKTMYRNHIKSHVTDAKVKTFICSTCGLISNKMEIIKHHIESESESPCFSSAVDEKILGLVYSCENCSLDFCTKKHLKDHRLSDSHSDDLFFCGMCRKSFKTLRYMRNHYLYHKECKEWQESFPITKHFVCNIGDCQEFYSYWTALYNHKKRSHKTEEKTNSPTELKCQFCQQMYPSQRSLSVHLAKSHDHILASIKCSYCKRNFNSRNILQKHIDKFHTPVECDTCVKKFKHRRNLETHMNSVHNNIKRYFCKYCQKGYYHKSQRTNHENTLHMDRHDNQLKFKCVICSKSFERKPILEIHLKKHHNKRNYSCSRYLNESGCDASFLTYDLMKKHAQTKHENSSLSINLKREEQRKKDHEVVQFENLTRADSSKHEKQPKTSHQIEFNHEDFEQDSIVSSLENDMEFEEQKPDTDNLTI